MSKFTAENDKIWVRNNQETIVAFERELDVLYTKAAKLLGDATHQLPRVRLFFKPTGMTLGFASKQNGGCIVLNSKAIDINATNALRDTLPHEFAHIVCMSNEKFYAFRLSHCPSRQYAMMVGIIKMMELNEHKEIVIHTTLPRTTHEEGYCYLLREWLLRFKAGETHGKDKDIAYDMFALFEHMEKYHIQYDIKYHKTHNEDFFKPIYEIIQLIDIPVFSSYKLSPMYILD